MVQFRDRIYVFDGIKEPEEYGSPLPPADRPDPNYTTVPTSTTVPVATTLPTSTTLQSGTSLPTSTTLP
jgi:hypothetical protein